MKKEEWKRGRKEGRRGRRRGRKRMKIKKERRNRG